MAKRGVQKRKTVFVSHISDETAIAQWLKARLDRDFLGGMDIFVSSDRSTIAAGQRWLDEVHQALEDTDLQIVLCSRASVGRPWINFEAGAVWLRDIPVVPVCHSGLQPDALPVPLSMLQGVVLSSREGLAKLYDAVAGALDLRTPSADFDAMATEVRSLEHAAELQSSSLETVERPRVLCAATAKYAQPEYQFDLDVTVMERYFPGLVQVERDLTTSRLRDLLTTQRYDIVHLVMPVEAETGSLVFLPIDAAGQESPPEMMSPPAFAALLAEARTRLVVLATCKALLLAVEVATVANMAASDQDLSGPEAAEWCDCFYRLLSQGKSVFKAFDITRQQQAVPIRAIRQKDVAFRVPTAS